MKNQYEPKTTEQHIEDLKKEGLSDKDGRVVQPVDKSMVNISRANKAEVLAALFNRARPLGLGILHFKDRTMSASEAYDILAKGAIYFDYLEGRVMKVNLSEDVVRLGLYDRVNGDGAAYSALCDVDGCIFA